MYLSPNLIPKKLHKQGSPKSFPQDFADFAHLSLAKCGMWCCSRQVQVLVKMLSWGTRQHSCLNTSSPRPAFRNALYMKQNCFGSYWDSDRVTETLHQMPWDTTTSHKHLSAKRARDDWEWCAVLQLSFWSSCMNSFMCWHSCCYLIWWKPSLLPCLGQDLSYSFSQASHDFMVFCILVIYTPMSSDQELS